MTKRQLIAFERKVAGLWERGKIKVPVHLSGGNEDELINIFKGIKKQDYVFSTHRNHYHYLLKTGNIKGIHAEILGRPEGICHGKSGSMHTIDHHNKFYSSGIVAGCVAIASGVASAIKRKGLRNRVFCFVGDGATDEGWFTEAWKYAVGHDLPITYIIEDNNRSVCSSQKQRWGMEVRFPFTQKIIYYQYTPTWPHVGTNRPIDW